MLGSSPSIGARCGGPEAGGEVTSLCDLLRGVLESLLGGGGAGGMLESLGSPRVGRERDTKAGGEAGTDASGHRTANVVVGCVQGIARREPWLPGAPSLPVPAGRSPVALVVHGHEVHEEHVVSHGVHAEQLHLEGGEHAPGDRTAGGKAP